MVMSPSYHPIDATAVSSAVIAVDCQKQVRSWSLLRSLIALLIPNCNCTSVHADDHHHHHHHQDQSTLLHSSRSLMTTISSTTTVTGTLFGFRRGKAYFCIQLPTTTSRPSSPITSTTPILLLELALPTTVLAKEMKTGVLRIALESYGGVSSSSSSPDKLLSVPVWSMYCNGKKVGYAVKRRPREWEMDALRAMESVVGTGAAGAGIITAGRKDTGKEEDDEIMFLRANFERVKADEAESFHLIEPDQGSRINMGQELSIFFFRSR